jgi:hypothetical protein
MTKADAGRVQALRAIFEKTNDAGERAYSESEIANLVPFVLLSDGAVDADELSDEVAGLLGSFVVHIGLDDKATPKQVGEAIAAYYEANPLNEALLADFLRFAGASSGGAEDADMASAKKLLGQAGSAMPVGARDGEGEKASPLSRFTLKVPGEGDGDG